MCMLVIVTSWIFQDENQNKILKYFEQSFMEDEKPCDDVNGKENDVTQSSDTSSKSEASSHKLQMKMSEFLVSEAKAGESEVLSDSNDCDDLWRDSDDDVISQVVEPEFKRARFE